MQKNNEKDALRRWVRNLNIYLHFHIVEAGISSTHFYAKSFPKDFCYQITVTHDGIDTDLLEKRGVCFEGF